MGRGRAKALIRYSHPSRKLAWHLTHGAYAKPANMSLVGWIALHRTSSCCIVPRTYSGFRMRDPTWKHFKQMSIFSASRPARPGRPCPLSRLSRFASAEWQHTEAPAMHMMAEMVPSGAENYTWIFHMPWSARWFRDGALNMDHLREVELAGDHQFCR